MASSLVFNRPEWSFLYDETSGEAMLRTAAGRELVIACRGAVSTPDQTDVGLAWRLVETARRGADDVLTLRAEETCWQRKTLTVEIGSREVRCQLQVAGRGAIDRVIFFAGFAPAADFAPLATARLLTPVRRNPERWWSGSSRLPERVFNPQPNAWQEQELNGRLRQRLSCACTFGQELCNTFFSPGIYAYIFDRAFCLGIAAPPGENRYHHCDYVPGAGWGLELHYDGMTEVDGVWNSPVVRIGLVPEGEVTAGLGEYLGFLRERRWAPEPTSRIPAWAWRPMVCGWGQQVAWSNLASAGSSLPVGSPITPGAGGYATQEAYEQIAAILAAIRLPYGTLTIDLGWSKCLTIPEPRAEWPDLRGFIRRQHEQGKKVLLWLGAWNPDGLPRELQMPHEPGLADCADPTNPEFRRRLREAIANVIAPAGCDADGFKLDFTGDLPRGRGYHPACPGLWGMELLRDYVALIHEAMREAKPDAVLETHCANPYFADLTEMLRLNDLFGPREDVRPMMEFRATMARLAHPGCPIDTDNSPFISATSWRDYLRYQPRLGVPSLYTLSHMEMGYGGQPQQVIAPEWFDELRGIWQDYLDRLA